MHIYISTCLHFYIHIYLSTCPRVQVRYCGQECRDRHLPPDHEEPWPVVAKYRPGVGRLLVAARDIDPGELIFTEECFAMGPNHTLTGDNCLECGQVYTDARGALTEAPLRAPDPLTPPECI